jgi:hypothetical protein
MVGTRRHAAAAVLVAALMAGGSARAADEPATPALAGTTWRAETITGRPVLDSAASTITFEADGRVSGQGGCDRYFGTSTIAGEQRTNIQFNTSRRNPAPISRSRSSVAVLSGAKRHKPGARYRSSQPMVGILNSAPARMPVGQREVTAFCLV